MRTCLLVAALLCRAVAPAPAASSEAAGPAVVESLGVLTGTVVDAGTGKPVPFANVVVLGARRGALSDEAGAFVITAIPPGSHTIRIQVIGCEPVSVERAILGGANPPLEVAVRSRWPLREATVELDSVPAARDFDCTIRPARAGLTVGDHPEFVVRIHNRGTREVLLPPSLDGSDAGRFPAVTITLEGPPEGLRAPGLARRGNRNALRAGDFMSVPAGGSFDPFANGWWPIAIATGTFERAGRYRATFHYSTNETQATSWLGRPLPQRLDPNLVEAFHHVPRVDTRCSCRFEVREGRE
jgi:hypothetical protein